MKRILPLLLAATASSTAFAQLPVSTTAENKNVVLEEFTGIYCTWCPAGHKVGNELKADNPGDVFLINIHAGGYANPQNSDPDFRTSFGTAIDGQADVAGYPAGTVNRTRFVGMEQSDSPGPESTAMSRNNWAAAAQTIMTESSYVNVALEGTLNATTRELTVDVQMYFTDDAPGDVNLNVALLQDHVAGPQTGAGRYPEQIHPNTGEYMHGHMLRHLLTGQWGEVVTTTTSGTTVNKTYNYTIPADLNGVDLEMGEFEIVAFVAEGNQTIITGNDGPIEYTNIQNSEDARIYSADFGPEEICEIEFAPSFVMQNKGGNTMTAATVSYGFAGQTPATYDWTGSLGSFEYSDEIALPTIPVGTGGDFTIEITAVNSTTDADATNNSMASTKYTSNNSFDGTNFELVVVQDNWGNETTWGILDDAGEVVVQGGPYSAIVNQNSPVVDTTATHIENITLSAVGCYELVFLDSYGDGIDGAWGDGGFTLKNSNGEVLIENDGNYGAGVVIPFRLNSLFVGLEETEVNTFDIYPNPAKDFVSIDNTELVGANINIVNTVGQIVKSVVLGDDLRVNVADLANGAYFMNINGEMTKAFSVAK